MFRVTSKKFEVIYSPVVFSSMNTHRQRANLNFSASLFFFPPPPHRKTSLRRILPLKRIIAKNSSSVKVSATDSVKINTLTRHPALPLDIPACAPCDVSLLCFLLHDHSRPDHQKEWEPSHATLTGFPVSSRFVNTRVVAVVVAVRFGVAISDRRPGLWRHPAATPGCSGCCALLLRWEQHMHT